MSAMTPRATSLSPSSRNASWIAARSRSGLASLMPRQVLPAPRTRRADGTLRGVNQSVNPSGTSVEGEPQLLQGPGLRPVGRPASILRGNMLRQGRQGREGRPLSPPALPQGEPTLRQTVPICNPQEIPQPAANDQPHRHPSSSSPSSLPSGAHRAHDQSDQS
jgi:hypothetical protein